MISVIGLQRIYNFLIFDCLLFLFNNILTVKKYAQVFWGGLNAALGKGFIQKHNPLHDMVEERSVGSHPTYDAAYLLCLPNSNVTFAQRH